MVVMMMVVVIVVSVLGRGWYSETTSCLVGLGQVGGRSGVCLDFIGCSTRSITMTILEQRFSYGVQDHDTHDAIIITNDCFYSSKK